MGLSGRDYDGSMQRSTLAACLVALLAGVGGALAQPSAPGAPAASPKPETSTSDADAPATPSPLDAPLFYQLLLGEITARICAMVKSVN